MSSNYFNFQEKIHQLDFSMKREEFHKINVIKIFIF